MFKTSRLRLRNFSDYFTFFEFFMINNQKRTFLRKTNRRRIHADDKFRLCYKQNVLWSVKLNNAVNKKTEIIETKIRN